MTSHYTPCLYHRAGAQGTEFHHQGPHAKRMAVPYTLGRLGIGFGDGQAPRVPGGPWQNEHEAGLMWLGHSVSPQVSGTSVPRYQSSVVHLPLAAPNRKGRAGTSSSCMAPGSIPPPDITQWKEAPPRETECCGNG